MLKNLFSKGHTPTEPGPEPAEPGQARSYTVGWLLNTERGSVIWDTPRPVRMESQSSDPRSVGQCPSVLDFDRRHIVINCPIDVHQRVKLTPGGVDVTNVLADKSPIRADALQRWIVFQPRHEWRSPQRPVLQMLTAPVSAHLVGRAGYRTKHLRREMLYTDELADVVASHDDQGRPAAAADRRTVPQPDPTDHHGRD